MNYNYRYYLVFMLIIISSFSIRFTTCKKFNKKLEFSPINHFTIFNPNDHSKIYRRKLQTNCFTIGALCCPTRLHVVFNNACALSCGNVMYLNLSTRTCVSSCPAGKVIQNNACVDQCFGSTPFLHLGKCYSVCPTGFISLPSSGQCIGIASVPTGNIIIGNFYCLTGSFMESKTCVNACSTTNNKIIANYFCCPQSANVILNNECATSCLYPFLYNNGKGLCTDTCTTYFGDILDGKGLSCLSSCPLGYVVFNNQCVSNCLPPYFIDGNFCRTSCSSSTAVIYDNNCLTTCPNDRPLNQNGKCVSNCSYPLPIKDTTTMKCVNSCPNYIENLSCVTSCSGSNSIIISNFYCCSSINNVILNHACVILNVYPNIYVYSGMYYSTCPASAPYANGNTCVVTCPPEYPYIMDNKFCVSKCFPYNKYVINGNKCDTSCPSTTPYVLGGTCVASCSTEFPYVLSRTINTNTLSFCVSYCNLHPDSASNTPFIDNSNICTSQLGGKWIKDGKISSTCSRATSDYVDGYIVNFNVPASTLLIRFCCPFGSNFIQDNVCVNACTRNLSQTYTPFLYMGSTCLDIKSVQQLMTISSNDLKYIQDGVLVKACTTNSYYEVKFNLGVTTYPIFCCPVGKVFNSYTYTCETTCLYPSLVLSSGGYCFNPPSCYYGAYIYIDFSNIGALTCVPCSTKSYFSFKNLICLPKCILDVPYSFNGNCVATCPTNYYPDITTYVCILSGSNSSLYLYSNIYYRDCPISTYKSIDKNCVSSCSTGFVLFNNVCTKCEDIKAFPILDGGTCTDTCPSNMYKSGNSCASTCTRYVKDNSKVTSCVSSCTAPFSYLLGTTCCPANNMVVSNPGMCQVSCSGTTPYSNGTVCVSSCPSNLPYIFGSLNVCVNACSNPFPYLNGSTCVDLCPNGTFTSSGSCIASCDSPNIIISTSYCCPTGNYLENGVCVTSCSIYYPYIVNNECSQTTNGSYLYKRNISVSSCPSGFQNIINNICCAASDNYTDPLGDCYATCPNSAPYINTTNKTCNPTCLTGLVYPDNQNKFFCVTTCPSDKKFNWNGICMNNCMGMYANGTTCVTKCPSNYAIAPELSCISKSTCTSSAPYTFTWNLSSGDFICMDSCYTNIRNSLTDNCRVSDAGSCGYISQEKYLCYATSAGAFIDYPLKKMVGKYVCDSGTSVTTTLYNMNGIPTTTCNSACLTYPYLTEVNTVCTLPTTLLKGNPVSSCSGTDLYNKDGLCVMICDKYYNVVNNYCLTSCNNAVDNKCYDSTPVVTYPNGPTFPVTTYCPSGFSAPLTGSNQCQCNQVINNSQCVSSCPAGYIIFNGYCTNSCPSGYSIVNTVYCCPSASMFIMDMKCVHACSGSFPYLDTSTNTCVPTCPNFIQNNICVNTCNTTLYPYINGKFCMSLCPNSLSDNNSNCVTSCPSTTPFIYQNKCYTSCDSPANLIQSNLCSKVCKYPMIYISNSNCLTNCSGSLPVNDGLNCTSGCVAPNKYTKAFSCINACDSTEYISNNVCVPSCDNINPYIHNNSGEKICVAICPNDAPLIENNNCVASCSLANPNKNGNNCVSSCSGTNNLLENTTCVSVCSTGLSETGICVKQCSTINPLRNGSLCVKNCVSPNIYIENNSCISSCSTNLSENNICVASCSTSNPYKNGLNCVNACVSPNILIQNNICVSSCTTSLSENSICVTSCSTSKPYIDGTTCVNTCPSTRSFIISATNMCVSTCPANLSENNICVTSCSTYNPYKNGQICVNICSSPNILILNNTCVSSCPANLSENNICVASCSSNNPYIDGTTCVKTCPSTRNLILNNTCVSTCPANLSDNNICVISCSSNNPYIDGTTCVKTCPSTRNLILNNTCVSTCPANLSDNNICVTSCSKNNPYKNGLTCVNLCPSPNNFILNNTCVSSCPANLTENNICVTSCSSGYPYKDGTTCVKTCPIAKGLIDSSLNTCVSSCPANLSEKNICVSSCSTDNPYKNGLTCVNLCPAPNNLVQNKICVSSCSGTTPLIENGICVSSCSKLNMQIVNGKCVECDSQKPYYNTVNKDCTDDCGITNHYLEGKFCVSQCSSANPYSNGYQCVDKCSSPSPNLFNNTCLSKCPDSNPYVNNATCVSKCIEPNKYIDFKSYNCTSECDFSQGNFVDSKMFCRKCNLECGTCSESSNICKTCTIGYYIVNNKANDNCVKICPEGYYFNDKSQCDQCPDGCGTCQNTQCLSCLKDFYYLSSLKSCVSACPKNGYYLDTTQLNNGYGGLCLPCKSPCVNCQDENKCTSCIEKFILNPDSNKCILPCDKGYYFSSIECAKCDKSCVTCKGPSDSDCLTCDPNIYNGISKGKCTTGCKEGEVQISSSCINILSCLSNIKLDSPLVYDISKKIFNTNLIYSLNGICEIYSTFLNSRFNIKWTDLMGGNLSNKNKTLTVDITNFKNKKLSFEVSLYVGSILVKTTSSSTYFKELKLIPVVSNVNGVFGANIKVDGSLSYDEDPDSNENLKFSWKCTSKNKFFKSDKCDSFTKSIIELGLPDYKECFDDPQITTLEISITLTISKGIKQYSTTIIANVLKLSKLESTIPELNIKQTSLGKNGEPLVFQGSFIDPSLDISKYSFTWNIEYFPNKDYINGKIDSILKTSASAFKFGNTTISLTAITPDKKTIRATYIFSNNPPTNGGCIVSPDSGVSLTTEFTFSVQKFETNSPPLKYRLLYMNSDNIKIDFSNGYFTDKTFTSSFVPISTNYYLEATDLNGLSTLVTCPLKVTQSDDKDAILNSLNKIDTSDTGALLNALEVISSSQEAYESYIKSNPDLIKTMDPSNNPDIIKSGSIDKYINYLNAYTTNVPLTEDSSNAVLNGIKTVTSNPSAIIQSPEKLTNYFKLVDNLLVQNVTSPNSSSNSPQNFVNGMVDKVLDNIYPGEGISINSTSFALKINKVSSYSVYDFNVGDGCKTFCLDKEKLSGIVSSNSAVSIVSNHISNTKILPINQTQESHPFSSDSVNITLFDNNKRRVLFDSSNYNYTFRLKLPNSVKNSTNFTDISLTACIQYTSEKTPVTDACITWYDYDNNEVICACKTLGLTVNVYDSALSKMNQLAQFPNPMISLNNPYSIAVIALLGSLLIISITIATYKDNRDKKNLIYIHDKNYDKLQLSIIEYSRAGLLTNYSFKSFYCYIIRRLHPVLIIFGVYNPTYSRNMRVLDFFLQIYLNVFFTFFPLTLIKNSNSAELVGIRDAKNQGKSLQDLEISIMQILSGAVISIISGFLTFIITTFFSTLLYEDVNKDEIYMKERLIKNYIKYNIMKAEASWKIKMHHALIKINSYLMFTQLLMNIRKSNKLENNSSISQDKLHILKDSPQINHAEKRKIPEGIEPSIKDNSEIPIIFEKKDDNLGLNNSVQDNSTMRLRIFYPACENYSIENSINLEIYAKCRPKFHKKIFFQIDNENRNFLFVSVGNINKIECSYISYRIKDRYTIQTPDFIKKQCLQNLKFWLMIAIYMVLLFYIAGFVQTIYTNYGSNFYKICFMPLVSMLFFNLVISTNIMILLSTFLMYFYGPDYVYNHTKLNLFRIIFNTLVPKDAQVLHKTILDIKCIIK